MKAHWLGTVALATAISTASAQPATTPPSDEQPSDLDRRDRSSIVVTLGVGAPTGTVGVEYAHVFHPSFELSAGIGAGHLLLVGLLDEDGYRVTAHAAVMPRLRVRFGAVRLTLGAGLSAGEEQYGTSPFSGIDGVDRAMTLLANGEAGIALASRGGWFGRLSLGFSQRVAQGKLVSTDPGRAPMEHDHSRGYIGAGLGRTL